MSRIAVFLTGVAVAMASCAGPDSAAPLLEQEPAGSPPVAPVITAPPTTDTSTTTAVPATPSNAEEADRAAQADLRRALVAARAVYADRGTYDVPLSDVGRFAPDVVFIELTDAYASRGVVYDSHDQRVTLHSQSQSGRWFCIDESVRTGTDYGFGDSFEDSLATCSDRTQRRDWSTAFAPAAPGDDTAPIGADEAAILHAFERFAQAIDEADHTALRATVFESTGCSIEDLASFWPQGRDLFDSVTFDIGPIEIGDGVARVSVTILDETIEDWDMIRYGIDWYHDRDPCPLLKPKTVEPQDASARDLLEAAHLATQTAFVRREEFSLSLDELNSVDSTITFVSADEAGYGLAGYVGTRDRGVILTEGSPGRWYCVVEYLRENTGYGVGATREELVTAAGCNQTTEGWPEPE